jgi:hypothetical protein
VLPLFKNGEKQLPANYRPIALLSTVGKVFEGQMLFLTSKLEEHLRHHYTLWLYVSFVCPCGKWWWIYVIVVQVGNRRKLSI